MSNLPLEVLQKVNTVEKLGITGSSKKNQVLNDILSSLDDNVNIQKIIEDLIELLINISKLDILIMGYL